MVEKKKYWQRRSWTTLKDSVTGNTLTPKQIADKLLLYSKKGTRSSFKSAAFLSILYITGSRVSELLQTSYNGKYYEIMQDIRHGIRLKDFVGETIINSDGEEENWLTIKIRVSKRGKLTRKEFNLKETNYEKFLEIKKRSIRHDYRAIPILYQIGQPDGVLIDIIDKFLDEFQLKNKWATPETVLFKNIGRNYALKLSQRVLGVSPHALRILRCQHLARFYGFSAADLKEYFKWKTSDLAVHYSRSDTWAIKQRLRLANKYFEKEQLL